MVLVSLSARASRLSLRESRNSYLATLQRESRKFVSLSTYSVRLSLRRVLQGARNSSRVVTRSQLDLVERGLFTGPQYFQNFCSGRSALQSLGDVLTFVHDGGDDGLESLVDSRLTAGLSKTISSGLVLESLGRRFPLWIESRTPPAWRAQPRARGACPSHCQDRFRRSVHALRSNERSRHWRQKGPGFIRLRWLEPLRPCFRLRY